MNIAVGSFNIMKTVQDFYKLLKSFYAKEVPANLHDKISHKIVSKCLEDLEAYSEKDPAANSDPQYVLACRSNFRAVAAYRVAHEILRLENLFANARFVAARISETAKIKYGIEIHPKATIGRRFVVDHGIGTVIGETTEIGDDCYILQCVILGARGIASNPDGKRHPTLGNRVQIGAFARILGPVSIGDDCFIGPHCLIKEDVERGSSVTIITSQQYTKHRMPALFQTAALVESTV